MTQEDNDLKIVEDERISQKSARQNLWRDKIAVLLAIGIVGVYALFVLVILVIAYSRGEQPPAWAVAVESSTVTAALAVIFKDHLPNRTS